VKAEKIISFKYLSPLILQPESIGRARLLQSTFVALLLFVLPFLLFLYERLNQRKVL
jgi:hypothetical protein